MIAALAAKLGRELAAAGARIVTAESCTGGWVAQAITSVPGSSAWFERGFVTYSNEAKVEMLGVERSTLERCGAVSEEIARQMVLGALRHSRASVALAVTGVAGPGGGTAAKPVGLVCFAWATEGAVRSESRRYSGDRESVRRQSVERALEGMLEMLASGLGSE
jgi:nicotinamide-nucleotide amidase